MTTAELFEMPVTTRFRGVTTTKTANYVIKIRLL